MRYILTRLTILFLIAAGFVLGPLLLRLSMLQMGLTFLGLLGVNIFLWYRIVRPHQIREKRLENGLCVRCGYDLSGNVSGTCPECGNAWG